MPGFRNYKKTSKKSKKSTCGKRSSKPRVVSSTVKSYVKSMIHKQIENKVLGYQETNISIAYVGSVTSPTYLNLCPNISQGTTAATRNGDEVTIVKGRIRGFVNLYPYNVTTNVLNSPIKIKMWLCRRKSGTGLLSGVLTPPTITSWNNFFQVANVSTGFTGGILDTIKYPNNETFTVFSTKTLELCPNMVNVSTNASQMLGASGRVSAPFSFDFGKHLGKLKYNDSQNVPTNKELFLVFQSVLADGSIPLVGSFAELHAVTEWEFEDA